MKKRGACWVFLQALLPAVLFAGEINFEGIFSGFSGTPLADQRKVEDRIEQEVSKFRSVAASRVLVPMADAGGKSGAWGNNEPRILNVDVILRLKKRKRLTSGEFRGINDLVASTFSAPDRVVQVSIRDEDGYHWVEDSSETISYFKAAAAENEILDRLNAQWGNEVNWTKVNVAEDGNCKINGTFGNPGSTIALQVRREVLGLLNGLCKSARLNVHPSITLAQTRKSDTTFLYWLERIALVIVGFACYGLILSVRRLRAPRAAATAILPDDGAIILTKIVERSPDEAAKWMVRALLSESDQKDTKESEDKTRPLDPQIFDQSS